MTDKNENHLKRWPRRRFGVRELSSGCGPAEAPGSTSNGFGGVRPLQLPKVQWSPGIFCRLKF